MKKLPSIKNQFRTLILLLCVALNFSCKKLIEVPPNPPGEIPTTQVFADSADILSAVQGIYANFNETVAGQNNLADGLIDNCTGRSGDEIIQTSGTDIDQDAVLVSNSTVATLWSTAYSNLYQMNSCLTHIVSTTVISQPLKQQLLGEIKVTRALYYFHLVNLFGGVPLVTGTDYRVNQILPRTTVDSVYNLIISDLTDAQTMLTPAYPSAGRARPNLYTAQALLAKVYLYRQQWANAASTASLVINSGVYSLEPVLNNVFLHGSKEAIWQLPAVGPYVQTADALTFVPYSPAIIPGIQISGYLSNAFETGDQRKTNWTKANVVNGVTYFYPFKYKNTTAAAATIEDFMFFRLSELYLIRAEALAKNNDLNGALDDMNTVRLRAGLGSSTAVSQTDILNAIMHERQVELFCEWGNRWYDLKRIGTIDAVLGAEKTGWLPYAALYPVPLTEIQSNPLLLQNSGYH